MLNSKRRQAMKRAAKRNKGRKKEIDLKKIFKGIGGWILVILVAGTLGYSVAHFGVQTISIIGYSMNDVLDNGDEVIVNKAVYLFGKPERFDLVAFKQRKNDEYYNVKRVIGLPGENVKILNGKILINDSKLSGVPFDDYIMTPGVAGDGVTLKENEYFLLGDNVNNSEDSRFSNVGNILKTEILGKVVYRMNPEEKKGKIE
ncbi:MAG: signal peptidase I [Lachnospiraceae bacterium]|nr:signal peptidase I [Lachnospiraceae bacterium]